MKRIIAACVLLVIIVTSYTLGYFIIKKNCDEASLLLNQCIKEYQKEGNAHESAEKLDDFWNKREHLLSVFVNHKNIDEIELAINSLLVYSSTDEKEIFNEYSGRVKTLIHLLLEDIKATPHTVL